MTTNFKRVDPEPNTRIGISNEDRSFCDDRLGRDNDRIDSQRWPPMVTTTSSLNIPPSPSSLTSSTVQNLQEQLELLRKEKKLKDPTKETKNQEPVVALSRQSCNYADPWPMREQNLQHQQYQEEQYQLQQHQHQLQNQQQYNPQNQSRNLQLYTQQHQLQQQHQLRSQQQYNQQNQLQQYNPQVEFDCLHPRDDRRSKVRFSQSLSVYDNYEDFDYSDAIDINSPTITNRKSLSSEKNDCKLLFMLQRARHCWYSRDELKRIKTERKEIVRELRKVSFDVSLLDTSVYELRGLEAYLSPETLRTTLKKRKEVLEVVFSEQNRQRQSQGRKPNVENIQLVSLQASEWFRTRAHEFAQKDAKEAQHLYWNHPEVMRLMQVAKGTNATKFFPEHQQEEQELFMVYEQLSESIGLMDIDDEDAGSGGLNDSTLSFWANSSWTKDLMDE